MGGIGTISTPHRPLRGQKGISVQNCFQTPANYTPFVIELQPIEIIVKTFCITFYGLDAIDEIKPYTASEVQTHGNV